MDLTSVYFQMNHEYFHTWLTLTDPTDEIEGPTGYLFVNVSVLGPNDEPVVHDIEDAKKAVTNYPIDQFIFIFFHCIYC